MASEITKLLPFRQYDDNDVINLFAMDGNNKAAGTIVKVKSGGGNLNQDLIDLKDDGSEFLHTLGNSYSPLYRNPLEVTTAAEGDVALGILLRDVRSTDENGENLRYYPEKKEELQCVLSGESVPVATKGVFTFMQGAFSGSIVPAPMTELKVSDDGLFSSAGEGSSVGVVLATGIRNSGNGDTHTGLYAIAKINF